jgi:hypothetical protein
MKKILTSIKLRNILVSFAFLVFLTSFVNAQTPQETIEKCISALGGKEKLESHKSSLIKGIINSTTPIGKISGEFSSTVLNNLQRYDEIKMKINEKEIVLKNGFDGNVAWTGSGGNLMEIPGTIFKDRSYYNVEMLLHYMDSDVVLTSLDPEELGGKKILKILWKQDTREALLGFYEDSSLPAFIEFATEIPRLNTPPTSTKYRTLFTEYMDLEGSRVPKIIQTFQDGILNAEITVNELKFNPEIDQTIFKKPVQ